MIEIIKDHLMNCCNSCHSENDVFTIIFKYKSSAGGTAVNLCKKCRKELIKVLEEEV